MAARALAPTGSNRTPQSGTYRRVTNRSGTDDRRESRTPFRAAVCFTGPAGVEERGAARDLSLGGMFIETAAPLPFGTRVVVSIPLPSSPATLQVAAVVRWVDDSGIGVQFMNLGALETHQLVELSRPGA